MPSFGSTFVNWQDYLAAQGDQPQQMAQGLTSQLDSQAGAAMSGIQGAEDQFRTAALGHDYANSPGTAPGINFSDALRRQTNTATDELNAAQDTYGLQALMQKRRAGTGYTSGMGLYDAALTGSAAGSKFQGLKGKYRDLFGGMEAAQGRAGALTQSLASGGHGQASAGPKWGVGSPNDGKRRARRFNNAQETRDLRASVGVERGPVQDEFANPQDWFERWGR